MKGVFFMKKALLLIALILSILTVFCSCGETPNAENETVLPESTQEDVTTYKIDPSVNYSEKLLTCNLDEIAKIELTLSSCLNGKIMCKTLVSEDDKKTFIDMLKNANLSAEAAGAQPDTVWGFAVRVCFKNDEAIWVYRSNAQNNDGKLITIGDRQYAADADEFGSELNKLYHSIAIAEREWIA